MDFIHTSNDYTNLFVGVEAQTPVLNGGHGRYINLDNAASTPALKSVQNSIDAFLTYYSSVHRGTGFKSQLSTHVYEQARKIIMKFVGAAPDSHTCIFGKNTTEALNKLARRFPYKDGNRSIVVTTGMEHHSNDLPWRSVARVVHTPLTPDGRMHEKAFDELLEQYGDQIALVAVCGASNVTGYLNPIHRLAEKSHAVGAQIAVDCAQLAPHRKVDMLPLEDPAHLDYIAISAHKMYAPFGSGALIGRRDTFERGDPDLVGGGTVEIVTLDSVTWSGPPDRDEAGSPNVVGAVALAAAIRQLDKIGMEAIAAHETELTTYALERLQEIPGLGLYGGTDPEKAGDRLGVVPFKLDGYSHFLVAAILGYEFGIGVRSGCFCAHPYILHLLGLDAEEAEAIRERMVAGDKADMPGLVRASFGLYNSREDVDALVEALTRIARQDYQGRYAQDSASGEYAPEGWQPDFERYFSINSELVGEELRQRIASGPPVPAPDNPNQTG